ncbi:hypothetical protein C1M55_10545 [Rhodococcus qingshengii]|nr:hypothetical protein C1M55_10545 [Rhodococcus qingshengii]OMQ29294.1 hypothetical protein BK799_27000 [Rhodococcus sp. D-1]
MVSIPECLCDTKHSQVNNFLWYNILRDIVLNHQLSLNQGTLYLFKVIVNVSPDCLYQLFH